MKKFIFLSVIAILFLFVGCDLLWPPKPPVVVKYTLEASASVGGTISPSGEIDVKIGSNQTFTLTPDSGFIVDSVVITNKYGIINSYPLTTNTYTLPINQDVYKIKVLFQALPSVQFELLTQKPWKYILYQARTIGTTDWFTQTSEAAGFTGTYIFDKNYDSQFFINNGNVLTGDCLYMLKQDSLIIGTSDPKVTSGGLRFKIITLSEDSLMIRARAPFYDAYGKRDPTKDIEVQVTYLHP